MALSVICDMCGCYTKDYEAYKVEIKKLKGKGFNTLLYEVCNTCAVKICDGMKTMDNIDDGTID